MSVNINFLKDDVFVFVEDNGNVEYDHYFDTVRNLKDALKTRSEDIGQVFFASKVKYSLPEVALKDALEEMFDQTVVPSDHFIYHEDFTVDELWDAETLGNVKNLLDDMLSNSGHFLVKTEYEIDCSAFVKQHKEV